MSKDIADLMKPRIIVENNYPLSPFKHHEIICEPSEQQIRWAKEFTLNFRFLDWWEDRESGEMPEYLIMNHSSQKDVVRTTKHNVAATHGLGFVSEHSKVKSYTNWLPATEQEYNEYLEHQKAKENL